MIFTIVSAILLIVKQPKPIFYNDKSLSEIQTIIKNWTIALNDNSKFYLRKMPYNDEIKFEKIRYKRGNTKLRMKLTSSELDKAVLEKISEDLKGSSLNFRRFYSEKRKYLNRIVFTFDADEELFPSSVMNIIEKVFNENKESGVRYGIYSDGFVNFSYVPEGLEVLPTNHAFKIGEAVGSFLGKLF